MQTQSISTMIASRREAWVIDKLDPEIVRDRMIRSTSGVLFLQESCVFRSGQRKQKSVNSGKWSASLYAVHLLVAENDC